ncbi:MAG TPA: 16S rRNA (guanine(527)-N(7))-methyltransferase RsmG [Phycisphaerae bacterium]
MSRDAFCQALLDAIEPWGLRPDERQLGLLWAHFERMVDANRAFNLTRLTDPVAAATQLYADSLSVIVWARGASAAVQHVIDVGTGAGFPAIPLAVLEPDWNITALDGTAKKVRFVSECVVALGLKNVQAVHARAELWHPPTRADLAVAKAVGPLADSLRFCERLVRTNGFGLVFKTPKVPAEELNAAQASAVQLGFERHEPFAYVIRAPDGPIERVLHVYRKVRESAARPRGRRQRR